METNRSPFIKLETSKLHAMSFANHYLSKQQMYPRYIADSVSEKLNLIITIPCFNEPDIIPSLDALWNCERPQCDVEVIVMVNSGETASTTILEQNQKTIVEVNKWIEHHIDKQLKFYVIHQDNLPKKFAGVGFARKIAMDEAVARFNDINNSKGIITGFDADSTCDTNYMVEIERTFQQYPKANGANIFYEHPLEGEQYSQQIYDSIAQYELYLRYYRLAMRYAGHPYAFHTVGSSFAVTANAYIKQGGMNRRQAGEDFYFLQKIIPLGNFHEITTTRVIPSPRISDRVPFGTGKAIGTFIAEDITEYATYNYGAFLDLKAFFDRVDAFYQVDYDTYLNKLLVSLPGTVRSFLKEDNFFDSIDKINKNCATIAMFRRKFFDAFNAFKVLKFLNYAHEIFIEEEDITIVAQQLLTDLGVGFEVYHTPKQLLEIYRDYEKRINELSV